MVLFVRGSLKWAGHVGRIGDESWEREQMSRKWRGNGGEDDRDCVGKTALIVGQICDLIVGLVIKAPKLA